MKSNQSAGEICPPNRKVRAASGATWRFGLLGAAAVLAGCATGGGKPQSTMGSPAQLEMSQSVSGMAVSAAAWPTSNWWEAFGDPQLNALVAEALADNPSLRTASARIRQALSVQELAESNLDPHLDSSLSSTRERFSSNGTTPHPVAGTWKTLNQGLLSGNCDLDFWGKNAAAVDAAIGRARAAEVDARAVRLMISSAVVQAYIAFDETSRQLAIEQQLLDQQKQLLGLTQRRLAAEIDSKVDLTQAESSLPATRANIAALNESMELSRNRLAALLGKGPDRGADIALPRLALPASTAIPSTLTADLIGRRPDVVAQRWRVEASSRDIDLAKARFYPDVNITAFLGLQSLGFPKFDEASSRIMGIGPAITLPIFDGGRLRANLAAQDATYDLAVEAYNQTLVDAVQDIADQLSSLKWLQERLVEQRQAVTTAAQAEDLSRKRYAGGLGTYIQVLMTQNAVLTQCRQLVVLESRAFALQANLSRALGGGYAPSVEEQHAAAY